MGPDYELPPQPCANECGAEMDLTRAVWWCMGGICCSEGCAREYTKVRVEGPA